ncbi:MAG: putative MFS family arabinose efflux permease [Saprospiraceae bacterium]|jgi:predicted MFS family arabinose efflux permease
MSGERVDTTGNYKWLVLGLLTLVYTFNFIDRQILVILSEPIKAELGLTDTQLGLLTGLAFAALYVILGIPIARFADNSNRKNIVAASLAAWSGMTALSGSVTSFFQLFLARVGVGIGEAGASPPAHAIISDYFPPKKRATALSIYSTGIYFGILLGYVIGGVIAKNYGWRVAFYSIGIPGVLFALIIYFVIKEPIKGQSDPAGEVVETPPLREVISNLLSKKTFWFVALGSGFNAFGTYGVGNFLPSFLIRVHEVDIATAGFALGGAMGIGGMLGTFFGGYYADKLQHKDKRWYMWIAVIGGGLNIVPAMLLFFTGNAELAMVTVFFTSTFSAFYLGPSIAVCHSLVNAKMRAFTSSIFFFILNLIGLGMGPLTIGLLSDYLEPEYGNLSLRYAFCITIFTGILSSIFFYMGSRTYRDDLATSQSGLPSYQK